MARPNSPPGKVTGSRENGIQVNSKAVQGLKLPRPGRGLAALAWYKRRLRIALIALVLLIAVLAITAATSRHDPVPLRLRQAAHFPVDYPDQARLPAGYWLDTKSFRGTDTVVLYSIDSAHWQLQVSVEAKPTDAQLNKFNTQIMPLHTQFRTAVGNAVIGAINAQTVVSLPAQDGAWILITAPGDFNQTSLDQVLNSFTSPL